MSETSYDPTAWTAIIEQAFFARLIELAGADGPQPVDDHDTYVLDVRRCYFHEVLVAAGRGELQPILCRFDLNWADAIEPARHHVRFVRPVTFASGPTCRMVFTREEYLTR